MMIEKNLGNMERFIRLVFGLGLFVWLANQGVMNGLDWFVAVVALFLVLNAVTSRCYLWHLLALNTHNGPKNCGAAPPPNNQ